MRVLRIPGVHRPLSDAWMLAAAVRERGWYTGADVLDVFTGSGVLAVTAAREGARSVTAVDLSRRAALAARVNARANGTRVEVRRGDLFAPVAGRVFDLITGNPPYLPAAGAELPARGIERAWDAGHDGRILVDRMLDEVTPHLRPGGRVVLVHSSVNGEERTLERLSAVGLLPEVLARHHGPLGPLLTRRAPMMEARGLLEPGQREEDVLVIAGRRPVRAQRREATASMSRA